MLSIKQIITRIPRIVFHLVFCCTYIHCKVYLSMNLQVWPHNRRRGSIQYDMQMPPPNGQHWTKNGLMKLWTKASRHQFSLLWSRLAKGDYCSIYNYTVQKWFNDTARSAVICYDGAGWWQCMLLGLTNTISHRTLQYYM